MTMAVVCEVTLRDGGRQAGKAQPIPIAGISDFGISIHLL